ncbi:hypothetical protein THRCLA_02007 [Thraustotheca clavata]|uniref:Dynein assembly factor 3, axonemal n=1 Tax=Thraustotheca clavata TaxID=74557 RepID=A0A1W0A6N8_9STRA|nr:hypothetical protein THRCLA_02007 [Thraustotheca clavata]
MSGNLLSLGAVNMWGFSPSFDLLDGLNQVDTINILVANAGDVRHILTSLSRSYQWQQDQKIHFYILENVSETLARDLILLQLIFEWQLPLRQRCNLFLQVFGNSLVQERTSELIHEKAKELIDFVCDDQHGKLIDLVDLNQLKMKQKDALVDTLQSYFTNVPFDVVKLRDQRLRHFYENRYDHRKNLYDWDYTMTLKKIQQASVIHVHQFKEWRNSGIAFEFGDQSYTYPNRTMAAYMQATKRGHGSVLCRGYWLDIIVGPYISFGVDCYQSNRFETDLFEIHNKGTGCEQNRHNTAEVAVFNVLSCLYAIETREMYKMTKAHDVYSGIGEKQQQDSNCTSDDDLDELDARTRARNILETFKNVKITLLQGDIEMLLEKSRYQNLFHHVFLSVHASSHLVKSNSTSWTRILQPKAKVSIESSVFLLPLNEDQRIKYMEKIVEFAQQSGLKSSTSFAFTPAEIYNVKNAVLHFDYTNEA